MGGKANYDALDQMLKIHRIQYADELWVSPILFSLGYAEIDETEFFWRISFSKYFMALMITALPCRKHVILQTEGNKKVFLSILLSIMERCNGICETSSMQHVVLERSVYIRSDLLP